MSISTSGWLKSKIPQIFMFPISKGTFLWIQKSFMTKKLTICKWEPQAERFGQDCTSPWVFFSTWVNCNFIIFQETRKIKFGQFPQLLSNYSKPNGLNQVWEYCKVLLSQSWWGLSGLNQFNPLKFTANQSYAAICHC